MLRVLLDVSAVPRRPAGAGVYTIELARGLAQRDDLALTLCARRDDAHRWSEIAPSARVEATVANRRAARLAWEQTGAVRLARKTGIECWHGPHYTLPLRGRVATVATIHDLTFFDHPEWHERAKVTYFRAMIRAASRRADALVTVSDHTADHLRRLGLAGTPVTTARHGVDRQRFRAEADRAADLAALADIGVTPPYVAFCGTLEPRKNLRRLIAAFAPLVAEHPDLRLVLAGGDGWGAQDVRAAIGEHGIATRVVRPGYISDDRVPALLRAAEVVAYPSLEEGFGLPALEALACGAPLVAGAGTAVSEVVGDAAILVDPTDVRALEHGLRAALDPDTARALRAAGPRHADRYSWAQSIDQHVDAYQSAVSRHRERAGAST